MRIRHQPSPTSHRQADWSASRWDSGLAVSVSAQPGPGVKTPIEALAELEAWRILEEQAKLDEPRWSREAMPLGVWIDPHPEAPGTEEALFTVMRSWEGASQGLIRLEWRLQNPDIHVSWTDSPVVGRENELGHTDLDIGGGRRIRHARITLLINPRIDTRLNPERRELRLHATILHEAGHALGLRHSEHRGDIMHPRSWQRPWLSERDMERIRRLYQPRALSM